MPKISQLSSDSNPSTNDSLAGIQASGPTTQRFTLANLINFFWTLANIPTGGTSPITRDNESEFAFVSSGLVWTADAPGSTKNASMTAGVVYINGRRISISAVTARTFTASDDTYIDVLDNGDGTGTLVYTLVSNNAASPALAANSMRIGIICCGATFIPNSGSVNQGQEFMILPIASSIAYAVTDSIGNLICPRDPNRKLLGQRQITSNLTGLNATAITALVGLSVPVIVPAGRKIKVLVSNGYIQSVGGATDPTLYIYDGTTVAGGTAIALTVRTINSVTNYAGVDFSSNAITPAATNKNYIVAYAVDVQSINLNATATYPVNIRVELM